DACLSRTRSPATAVDRAGRLHGRAAPACGSVRAAVQCRRPLRSARRVALDRLGTALAAEPAGVVLSSMDASTGINVAPAAVEADAALRAVALFEGLKGALSLAAAVGLLFAGATRLQ